VANGASDPDIVAAAIALGKSAKSDVLLINGPCFDGLEVEVLNALRKRKPKTTRPQRLIFVLTTPGGQAEVAFRIARAMQDVYSHSTALIGGWCKSAGTLCVIAANEVAMSDDAELGPLDVQLAKRDELDERDSGLVIEEALRNLEQYAFKFFDAFMHQIKDHTHGIVTLKMASEISANVTKGLFEPIYRQIDPQKIGEIARSMEVGKAYASRLNLKGRNLKPRALMNLLVGYPSHGFVIDRQEAAALFSAVRAPTSEETVLLSLLGNLAMVPNNVPTVHLYEIEVDDENANGKGSSEASGAANSVSTQAADRSQRGSAKPRRNSKK